MEDAGEKIKEMTKEHSSRFKSICVFCGSSNGKKVSYQDAAIDLGKELVKYIAYDLFLHVSFSFIFTCWDLFIFFSGKKISLYFWRNYLFFIYAISWSGHFYNAGIYICKLFVTFIWYCVQNFPLCTRASWRFKKEAWVL